MGNLTLRMPQLHSTQEEVRCSQARFKILACGRRKHWGKTKLAASLCIGTAAEGGKAWWVAPSYPMASIGWREIRQLTRQIPGTIQRDSERMITLPSGGFVQVKSADNPDSLRGEGLDFVALDECAFMREEAWIESLRPALSDRKGKAMFVSTPKGRNWFWRLYQHGLADWQEFGSWSFPTSDNPFIDEVEIQAAKNWMPERVFRQEFLAEFMDDAGGVFRRVMEAATSRPQERAQIGHMYVIGVDWGRTNDATVFKVMDMTEKAEAYSDRMVETDFGLQLTRLKGLQARFNAVKIVAEYNSLGGPQVEALQREGLPVVAFQTTNASKMQLIDALALAFERGDIRILPDPGTIGELQAFESERLPSGAIRYGAPQGMNDDCVIALALAWLPQTPPIGATVRTKEVIRRGIL